MPLPTIGRQVWYRPHSYERLHDHTQPFAATVVHVWSDECVNLAVLNENGTPLHGKTSVHLCPENVPAQPGQCEWMPSQIAAAKKDAVGSVTYPDGTTVTGVLPLPADSPAA